VRSSERLADWVRNLPRSELLSGLILCDGYDDQSRAQAPPALLGVVLNGLHPTSVTRDAFNRKNGRPCLVSGYCATRQWNGDSVRCFYHLGKNGPSALLLLWKRV
jgi:hypothetical protein